MSTIKNIFRNYYFNISEKLNFFSFLNFDKKTPLRVLIFHDLKDLQRFSELIDHLSKSWQFITPNQFFEFIDSNQEISKPSLLITFDDGFKDNLHTIPILHKFSISAIFFVCPGLIELQKTSLIFPILANNLYKINSKNQDLILLDWDDLRILQNNGLSIGNHSSFHFQLNNLSSESLKMDINFSKSLLEKNLKFDKAFHSIAFPFGGINHINKTSLKYLSKEFKYIFSGLRGNNLNNSKFIFRDSISLKESFNITNSILKGNLDILYQIKLIKLFF